MSLFWRRVFTVEAVVLLSTIVGAAEHQEGEPNCRTAAAAAIKKPLLGYQLDVSRDKVPTMGTFYRIVDLLAACGAIDEAMRFLL